MGTSLERWTTWEKKETHNNEDELQTNNYGSKSTLRHWLAVIANRDQTFSTHRHQVHTSRSLRKAAECLSLSDMYELREQLHT